MIALPALQSLKKLFLSYEFLATSPNFFDCETKVMLKEINSKKGKDLNRQLPSKLFLSENT